MFRNALILASILMLLLAAACTSQSASAALATSSSAATDQIANPSQLTVKDKLGIGILSLNKAGLPISTEQAAVLLPLWQVVRSLGTDKNASSAELAALYVQIQDTLTADQVAQIEQFTWSQTELTSLVQQYQSQTMLVSSTVKPTTTTSTSTTGQNMGGGPGGDMLPPDGGIMMGGGASLGMTPGQSTTGETQQSLIQNQLSSQSSVDLNVLLANAVINLLQQQVDA
jgi:hypothetical protein